ncbi:septation protein SepH [Corynebacterium sp. A21]|uniref:septation protein SepH n=1 Tax=Corynebacterium sp. A21 TaxID=3457318 RepID=UPI003FD104C3
MRELFLVSSESTESSLVFRNSAEPSESAEQFFLAVDENLRAVLLGRAPSIPEAPTQKPEPEPEAAQDNEPEPTPESEPAPETRAVITPPTQPRPPRVDPDPRISAPLTMRPREIQDRVRAGATTSELAEEMGVTEARVEPYAHPVLLERARVAEVAKQAHPVRDDGPARLTLWEVLATAFAARGNDLAQATWDAYRDGSGQWVIRVSWQVGHTENTAEWTFQNHTTSSPTAVARNSVAADLTDPDFVQPVRSLSSVGGSGIRYVEDFEDHHEDPDEVPEVPPAADEVHAVEPSEELREPEPEQAPAKRRRKAVTPHWEDVLLGVRTNTKRPKN